MLGLMFWLLIGRLRGKADSTWPLVFYAALVAFHQAFPGQLVSYPIFIGVVTALLLRFEFTGDRIGAMLRAVEILMIVLIISDFVSLVLI